MAGQNLKLVNKLARRARSVKEAQRGKYDRENKLEKTLRKSPRAYQLARKAQRRDDRNWGPDAISQKPVISYQGLALTLDRHFYGGSTYGMRLTLAAGLEAAIGLQPLDVIRILQGNANGFELLVVALTDSTHVQLQDLASYAYPGTKEITSITAVADTAGSLNSKFFEFNSADNVNQYYVWFDDGTGVDPAPVGRTGIHVVYSDGASASTIGGLTRAAITSAAGSFVSVSGSGASIVITNLSVGATTDASDGSAPTGFAIVVTQQGSDANASPSESNINFLALLSSEKKSYT